MNDAAPEIKEPDDKRDPLKDYTHRELRETLENAIKFIALGLLLIWTRDHTHNVWGKFILTTAGAFCFFSGALLRVICVLALPQISNQLMKEFPFLSRKIFRELDFYRLFMLLVILILLGIPIASMDISLQ